MLAEDWKVLLENTGEKRDCLFGKTHFWEPLLKIHHHQWNFLTGFYYNETFI